MTSIPVFYSRDSSGSEPDSTLTVATTSGTGEITFDPIASPDAWTATAGAVGEIILEAA